MKLIHLFGVLLASSTLEAQTLSQTTTTANSSPANYIIGQQGANSQVWQKVTQTIDAKGNVTFQTNQAYVELATGLNHLVNGQWVASKEEIDILPDGSSAAATNGQHQAYFPGNIYSGQIKLVTPDGQTLQSQPIGLSYFDGTNSVLIAEVTNSTGAILPSGNQAIYTNAFSGLNADLLYTYTKAGFSQDVILRQQPPDPVALGLNPQTTRLQVLTEFISAPQPGVSAATVPTEAGNLENDSLSFGAMTMGDGKAFLIGTNYPSAGVNKRWLVLNGRQFLIEEVPIVSIAKGIDTLPPFVSQAGAGTKPVVSKNLIFPPQRLTHASPKANFLAKAMPPDRGLVLDYQILNSSLTNYTFQGDTTYYISGLVYLYGTNNILEGGAVLKFATNNTAGVEIDAAGAINCQTAPYRPAILTAIDDNSVGQAITNSTGNPTNYYGSFGLEWYNSATLHDLRLDYLYTGLQTGMVTNTIRDVQFVNCYYNFVYGSSSTETLLQNVLMQGGAQAIYDIAGGNGLNLCVNCTFHNVGVLGDNATMTNCLVVGVSTNFCSIGGVDNVFLSSDTGVFQSIGAGANYLASNSPYRNAGTTNIDPVLLAMLRQKTTYPPIVYSNVTVTSNVTLSPQAQRDTNASPNLGYHYDPIDYLVTAYTMTNNSTLTVTNGTAIAYYDTAGIWLQDSSSIVSEGTPLAPNWFVRYQSVQEQPVSLDGLAPSGAWLDSYHSGAAAPNGSFRFTKFACPAGGGYHLYDSSYPYDYSSLSIRDCEFYSGLNFFTGGTNSIATLKNNLFDRSAFSASGTATNSLSLTNDLFWGVGFAGNASRIIFVPASGSIWNAFNNEFDTCYINSASTCTNGYNAYYNCTNYVSPTNATDIFLTNALAYQTGPFGTFYQPTNSPLIRMGSTTANLVGLYHYTVTTNEVVEGTNIVSIGYHYIATGTNGLPLDSNGNGIPDYLEDPAGNGQPFIITLIAPLNGSSYGGPTNIPIQATVVDWRNLVTNMEFFQGSVQISAMTGAPYTYTWPIVAGSYSLTAVGQDNGGVIATSTPVSVTVTNQNLELWLRADAGVTTNGAGQISTWADQSGNTNNATQSTTANQPTYVTNALNGLPVVQFNLTNSQYFNLTNFLTGTTQAEAFVVLQSADLPGVNTPLWNMGSGTYSKVGYPYNNGQIVEDFGSTLNYTVGTPAQPLNQYHVYEVAGQNNFWGAWINGMLQYQTAGNTYGVNTSSTSLELGCSYYGGSIFQYFSGDVAEVLIFNQTLSASQRLIVNNYLDLKYGLVTNAPPTPTNLVALAISTNQVGLTWNFNFGTSGTTFQIARATTSNGVYTAVAQVANTLSYVDTNLAAGTTYYYEVAAQNAVGTSGNSNPAWATTLTNGVSLPFGASLLWLKADTGVVLQGTNNSAGVWLDQSGNYNNATQSTTAQQPSWVAGTLNGLPVVQFNGNVYPTNSYLALPNFLGGATQAEAIVVLQAATDPPARNQGLWHFGTSGAGALGYPTTSGTIQDDFGTSPSLNLGVPALLLTQPHIYDVYSKTNDWRAWINGILQYQTANQVVSFTTSPALGLSEPYGENNNFAGNIAELLIFNRTLTAGERATVNGYLFAKYGMAPTVPPAPTNLVAMAVSPTEIALNWSETLSWGVTQISIERKTGSGGTYAQVAQILGATSYVDTNLTAGTTYYYRARAINLTQWSGYSNETNATTLASGADMPLGNLLLWLKADSGLPEVGTNTPVYFWADQSGNNNNADVSTLTNQALLVTNVLNGEPVVQFSGTNSSFNLPNFLNGMSGAEVFVVVQAATNLPSSSYGLWEMGNNASGEGCFYPQTGGSIVDNFGSESATVYNLGVPSQPLNQYSIYEVSSQAGNWEAWINGMWQYQNTNNAYYWNGTSTMFLGNVVGYFGNYNFFAGDIAEMLVFNRPLTGDEKIAVGDYLFSKYNLSPFATNNSPPSFPTNVTAVGLVPGQLSVQWARTSTNETAFNVERKVGVGGTYQIIGSTITSVTNFVDVTAIPANTNYYRIKAVNYFGNSGYSPVISPPSVSLTNWPGTILANTTNLLGAQAADANGTITSVGFFVGAANLEKLLGTASSAPYTANWVSGREGPWSLTAMATDSLGNSQFSTAVTVMVYLSSNTNRIPDYLLVKQGNNPLNPWIAPTGDTNTTPPTINLVVPVNTTLLP